MLFKYFSDLPKKNIEINVQNLTLYILVNINLWTKISSVELTYFAPRNM